MKTPPLVSVTNSVATLAPPKRRTRFVLALDAEAIAQLAAVTGLVGQPGFYAALVTFLRSMIGAEVGLALVYSADQRPAYLSVQADAARQRGAREAVYIDGPYVLDPVYQLYQKGQVDGAYRMADYVPDDFYESEFYRCFFRNTHLIDTIDVLWRIDERSAIAICLGREEGTPAFGSAELALVRHTLPLIFAAMRRHHEIALPPARDEADRLVHRKVESTMANFGSSLLTKREREVVFYMLSGYSSEQTALRLHTPLRQTSCRLLFHADDPRRSDTTCKRFNIHQISLSRRWARPVRAVRAPWNRWPPS
ncbi:hypothetical protein BH11PSE9_BH11PSE9_36730 [soil metagenome]